MHIFCRKGACALKTGLLVALAANPAWGAAGMMAPVLDDADLPVYALMDKPASQPEFVRETIHGHKKANLKIILTRRAGGTICMMYYKTCDDKNVVLRADFNRQWESGEHLNLNYLTSYKKGVAFQTYYKTLSFVDQKKLDFGLGQLHNFMQEKKKNPNYTVDRAAVQLTYLNDIQIIRFTEKQNKTAAADMHHSTALGFARAYRVSHTPHGNIKHAIGQLKRWALQLV